MANTATPLAQEEATTSPVAIYTVGAGVKTIMKSLDVCNNTNGSLTFRLWLVPSGHGVDNGHALIKKETPIDGLGWGGEQVLLVGTSIYVSASGVGLTVTISGIEITA